MTDELDDLYNFVKAAAIYQFTVGERDQDFEKVHDARLRIQRYRRAHSAAAEGHDDALTFFRAEALSYRDHPGFPEQWFLPSS